MDIKAGDKFGRLTVISCIPNTYPKRYECICECGNTKITKGDLLKRGECSSCGCLKREILTKRNYKHGMSKSRLFKIWVKMIERCEKEYSVVYKHYGGRGIAVCDEWHDFSAFMEWALNNGYSESLTIDRIDNNKGYSPDNCKWATMTEQANNKRNNVRITVNGETMTINQWARALGINRTAIKSRLKNGVEKSKAITTPFRIHTGNKYIKIDLYQKYIESRGGA